MKATLIQVSFQFLSKQTAFLWNRFPLSYLLLLYVVLFFTQKQLSAVLPEPSEQYYHNNHLPVNKLGQGSICVHLNQPVRYYQNSQ